MLSKRFVFRCLIHPNLNFFRLTFILFTLFFLLGTSVYSRQIRKPEPEHGSSIDDTVLVKKGQYILMRNTIITIPRDTFYIVNEKITKRDSADAYKNSQVFYDTVYQKFSRKKITQLLYNLAFIMPKQSDLPDTLQVLKSNKPFEEFRGKVIRSISIKILPPFGASIFDTSRHAATGVGKALNSVHVNTRKYVIRRNLLFKKG